MAEKIKTMYVCTSCGALYTEHVPADEGTAPCDDCGNILTLLAQNTSGVVTIDQLFRK